MSSRNLDSLLPIIDFKKIAANQKSKGLFFQDFLSYNVLIIS